MKLSVCLLSIALSLGCTAGQAKGPDAKRAKVWPVVASFSKDFEFLDHTTQFVTVTLTTKTGTPLYILDMAINSFDYADDDFQYSGDFECRLVPVGKSEYSNLLPDEGNAYDDEGNGPFLVHDSFSRGRFLRQELAGNCWEYPDFGHIRCFGLRGMRLCVDVVEFELEKPTGKVKAEDLRVSRVKCKVTVVPDASALSETSKDPDHRRPKPVNPASKTDFSLECSQILKR